MSVVRVGIVVDHEVVREGMRAVAAGASEIELVAAAPTAADLLVALGRSLSDPSSADLGKLKRDCDVVLLDLSLQDKSRPSENVDILQRAGIKVLIRPLPLPQLKGSRRGV